MPRYEVNGHFGTNASAVVEADSPERAVEIFKGKRPSSVVDVDDLELDDSSVSILSEED